MRIPKWLFVITCVVTLSACSTGTGRSVGTETSEPTPELALWLASEGRHEDAVQVFEQVRKRNPGAIQSIHGHKIAVVYAVLGDRARHKAHCRWLMDRYRDAVAPTDAERSVKGYLLYPSSRDRALLEHALKRTRYATDHAEAQGEGELLPWFEGSRGMAEYRMGNYSAASTWLEKSATADNLYTSSVAMAFFAMSEHAQGHHERARELLEQTRAAAEQLPEPGTEAYAVEWTDTLTTQLALSEAERVIGGR